MATLFMSRARAVMRPARSVVAIASLRRTLSITPRIASAAAAARPVEDDEDVAFNPEPRYRTILPVPLPSDIESTQTNSKLYPSTRLLDTLSLLSVCLRRPQSVRRAYQIFNQLLTEVREGKAPVPEGAVWGEVIEAVLRNAQAFDAEQPGRAEQVAPELVSQWEVLSSGPSSHFSDLSGQKVYKGWLKGLLMTSASLDSISGHLQSISHLSTLLDGFPASDLPVALNKLADHALKTGDTRLAAQVEEAKGATLSRLPEVETEELKPMLEVPAAARKQASTDAAEISAQPRFAITNLKTSLSSITGTASPLVRQHLLEQSSLEAARAEMEHAAAAFTGKRGSSPLDDQALQQSQLQSWMFEWLELLTVKLTGELGAMRKRVAELDSATIDAKPQRWGQSSQMKEANLLLYITLLTPDKLALITILEIMRLAGSGGIPDGMKTLRGLLSVGKAVETEYRADTIKGSAGTDSPEWLRTLDPQTQKPNRMLVGSVWNSLGKVTEGVPGSTSAYDDLRNVWTPAWSQMVQLSVGSFLVDALLGVARVTRTGKHPKTGELSTEVQEAFSHSYEFVRGRLLGVIKLNPVVASRLARDRIGVIMHPKHLPMLVPPRPWKSFDDGAYLLHRVPVMRLKDSNEQTVYLKKASVDGVLEPVFAGLDVLSATPWKINRAVYDVVSKVWNSGEALAEIPANTENEKIAPLPAISSDSDFRERTLALRKIKTAVMEQRKNHAERCKVNYLLEVARSYLNDVFYIPHNLDFRGRAYPIPPHLSPVGDDICRGLLTFGTAKPLGATGVKWLQIHLANVYGYDKASFEERVEFSKTHVDDILDSAANPLDGRRWWLQAEDPWQCLAACVELAGALTSPDPEQYLSSLPVHQDGTCNGMQHYAALGGDSRGARAVNLENGDRPADIYSGVADLANKVIREDAAKGIKLAQLIEQPLGRKVVKQTVMTTVYGVTFVGAKDQIAKQLIARGDIAPEHVYAVSSYVAKTVLSCIGDLFGGATAIQDWLTTAARLISRSVPPEREDEVEKPIVTRSKTAKAKMRGNKELMTSVVWTTPLGLPVVQPYRKATKKQVMTALQTVYISDPNAPSEVSPRKQATAFPPNFIHSLDATHMLLTALKCRQHDITFAAVHDSYWTHASTVEPMSNLIRDTFVHLHSQDLVGELRQEFVERYGNHLIALKSSQAIEKAAEKRLAAAKKKAEALSLSPSAEADLAEAKASRKAVANGAKYVRFADVLPPCPPKGEFDVNKIRASQYFFS